MSTVSYTIENATNLVIAAINDQITDTGKLLKKQDIPEMELVHELRKAIKRIRALAGMLEPLMQQRDFFHLDELLRQTSQLLASQRDSVVNYKTFQYLIGKSVMNCRPETILAITDYLANRVKHAYSDKFYTPDSNLSRFESNLDRVRQHLHFLPIERAGIDFFISNIENSYIKASVLYKTSRLSSETEVIHAWRKSMKKVLLQLKFNPFFPAGNKSVMSELLNELTDLLGKEHDLALLADQVKNISTIDREQKKVIGSAIEIHKRNLLKLASDRAAVLFKSSDFSFIQMLAVA